MHFYIVTLFPESIQPYLESSILGRAQKKKKISVSFYNPRDYTKQKKGRVDQKPYGGGPGMVLEAEAVLKAVYAAIGKKKNVKVFFLSPHGKEFNNTYAKNISKKYKHVLIISGNYEGIDARVKKILKAENVSVGPYVVTGGELPAAIMVDSISRHIAGVLGNKDSIEEDRISSPEVYTRPEVLTHKGKKYKVPKVLLSGNHKEIEAWKQKKRLK